MASRFRVRAIALGAAILIVPMSGCATILGGGTSQGLSIASDPPGAKFVVKSASGLQFASGTAPQMVRLPRKNEYQVEFSVPGYQTQSVVLSKGMNGWIWGNLFVGWIVGFGIDFMTGSANKLEPSQVSVNLVKALDDDGILQLYGHVRQLDERGKIVEEQRVLLVPAVQH